MQIGKLYFSGTVTITDESGEDIAKDDDILCNGKSTAEIDDDSLSDCSWNMRTNSTKKNKK